MACSPTDASQFSFSLIPDVNLFLQCRSIKDLPWQNVSDSDHIIIYIGRTLQEEVVALKSDGNQRRSRRARDANSFFKQLLRAPDGKIVLKESKPRVESMFMPKLDSQRVKLSVFDLSKADDRHVEEAAAFCSMNFGRKAAILTHDIGPILTAREVGIAYVEIPDDWLLEPDKDDKQKQIDDLTRQVKTLKKQYPDLSTCSVDVYQKAGLFNANADVM
jgi:hypothetical protein